MRVILRLALALLVGASAIRAEDEDLLLSPRQDAATWEKAWTTWVTADYHARELGEIFADLSERAGIAIDCYVFERRPNSRNSGQMSGEMVVRYPNLKPSAARFLKSEEAARLRRATIRFSSLGS